jgi:hypothetical protein
VCLVTEVSWLGVQERVAAIARADASKKVFGASRHRFMLYPVLTISELLDLEQSIDVRLPEEYRAFLLEVGNGGAGPGYGLERVEQTAGGWRWSGHGVTTVAKLGVPFRPFTAQVYAQHEAKQPVEKDFPDHASFVAASRVWTQRMDDLYDEETFGTIAISHQGCGYYWLLVVSGPERGTVWDDSRATDAPLSPLTGSAGERLTFARWYLNWLSRAETAIASKARS